MDTQLNYEDSVAHEREAWQALQSHQPGTPGRAKAWEAWAQAIVQTNKAWRMLSTSRAAQHHARA